MPNRKRAKAKFKVGQVVSFRVGGGEFVYERIREVREDATVWLGGAFGKRRFVDVRPLTAKERGK